MDQTVINWILGAFGGLVGFLLKTVWEAVKDLQVADKALAAKVSDIEILVAGAYVRKDEFSSMANALFVKLDKIMDKLDNKVDK
jgi:hypothetical protein